MAASRQLHPLEKKIFDLLLKKDKKTDGEMAVELKKIIANIKALGTESKKGDKHLPNINIGYPEDLDYFDIKVKFFTPLAIAVANKLIQCVEVLVKEKSSFTLEFLIHYPLLRKPAEYRRHNWSVCVIAIDMNMPKIFQLFLNSGALKNSPDSVLEMVLEKALQQIDTVYLKNILDSDNSLIDRRLHASKSSLLITACKGSEPEHVKLLVERGANQQLVNTDKSTAIHEAYHQWRFEVIILLQPHPEICALFYKGLLINGMGKTSGPPVCPEYHTFNKTFKEFFSKNTSSPAANYYAGLLAESEKSGSGINYFKKAIQLSPEGAWKFPLHGYQYFYQSCIAAREDAALLFCCQEAMQAFSNAKEWDDATKYFEKILELAEFTDKDELKILLICKAFLEAHPGQRGCFLMGLTPARGSYWEKNSPQLEKYALATESKSASASSDAIAAKIASISAEAQELRQKADQLTATAGEMALQLKMLSTDSAGKTKSASPSNAPQGFFVSSSSLSTLSQPHSIPLVTLTRTVSASTSGK